MLISKFDNTNIEKEIEDFEYKYSFEFPDMYKDFLLKYNGGKTPKSEFKINKISSDIRAFYGLGNADKYYHYDTLVKINMFNDWLEEQVIPIATNVFGDYIMIGIGSENNGKIFFCYHDRPNKPIELTKNFKEFLERCKSKKIDHIQTVEERMQKLIKNGNEKNITPALIKIWEDQINEYANMHQEELTIDKVE